MRIHARTLLALIAAVIAMAPAARAATVSTDQEKLVIDRTTQYFDAVRSGDYRMLAPLVSPDYRLFAADGNVLAAGDVAGKAAGDNLEGSKPQGRVAIANVTVSGNAADERASTQTYTFTFVAGTRAIVRRYTLTIFAGRMNRMGSGA